MGYETNIVGEIKIEPPVTYAELKALSFTQRDSHYPDRWTTLRTGDGAKYGHTLDLAILVEIEEVDTEEGKLIRTKGVAVVPMWDGGFKAYHVEDDMKWIVNELGDHAFIGHLRGEGEENLDIWRLRVNPDTRQVIMERPTLVWPDGTEETMPG